MTGGVGLHGSHIGAGAHAPRNERACLFIGPSFWDFEGGRPMRSAEWPKDLDYFGPAAMGAIHQAFVAGYRRIGLVDGLFGDRPAPWHKEILFVMHEGAQVFGAASMGALRHAELDVFGMKGAGAISRLVARGAIEDDDEVCVAHMDASQMYRPVSVAMIDIRFTARRLRRRGLIDRAAEKKLVEALKAVSYPFRTLGRVADQLEALGYPRKLFAAHHRSSKAADAFDLAMRLSGRDVGANQAGRPWWRMPMTDHWRYQFILHRNDLPELIALEAATPQEGERHDGNG